MVKLGSWSAYLLLCSLVACGGKSFEADPDGEGGTDQGGTGQGGSGSAGKTNKGGTSSGGSTTAGTGQGGSAGSLCEAFDDGPEHYVQVAIYNKTSRVIHLGDSDMSCATKPLFEVYDAQGAPLSPPGDCRASCETLRQQGPIGCPAVCAYPTTLTLQPGDAHYTAYHGRYVVQRELPAPCVDASYGVAQCEQAVAIQPGMFAFLADAGTSLDCSLSSGPCGACTPHGAGGCSTPGSLISGETLYAKTQVYLDGSYGVYGARRLPTPEEYPGGEDIGAAPLAQVELVFTD